MRIKRVEATNLKGRTFAYDLETMVAIIGDNFSGKSSVIDAIRLPMIGHIPEMGKANAATWQLASGLLMNARVTFDNGDSASLNAVMTAKGSPTITQDGFEFTKNIPLLNASAYFAMTERERYDYVFNIAKMPEDYTIPGIIAELERISFEEDHTEAIEKEKATMIGLLKPEVGKGSDVTVQTFLEAVIPALKAELTAANARVKDTQGAIRVLTELKNRQEQMTGNARQLATAEKLARSEAEAAYKRTLELQARLADAKRYLERVERVEQLRVATQSNAEIEKLEGLIREATAMLKPKVESSVSESELEQLESHLAQLTRDYESAGTSIQSMEGYLSALGKAKECPYCHSKSKGWKDNLEAAFKKTLSEAKEKAEGAQSGISPTQKKLEAARAEIARARADLAFNRDINQKILGWQQRIDDQRNNQERWAKELRKEEAALAGMKVEAPSQKEIDEAASANKRTASTLEAASANLKAAELLEHDLKRAAQAQLEHEQAAARVAVIKRIDKLLQEKKAALVDLVFTGLLRVANGIVGNILATPLAFHEGEVGRWNGANWISHKTFSGTEQALTFVAIAAALSQGAPLKLLIFDELGRLDKQRQRELCALLKNAIEKGWIDQFIVAGAVEKVPSPWLQVIAL